MPLTESAIQLKVDSTISAYGSTIGVLKFASAASDLYKQGEPTFSAAVNCTGRAIINPTPEKVSVIGNDESFDLAVLFSRTEMVAKFPLIPTNSINEGAWITVADRISWGGRTYEVVRAHSTGRVKDYSHLLVLLCKSLEGRVT